MTERSDLAQRVQDFAKARILCVGDVMLDRYVYGTVERISPEAPIPILAVVRETAMLGGAGNVVRNLAALKASCCFVSLIGEDPAGREVTHLIAAEPLVEPNLLPSRAASPPSRCATSPDPSSCCAPTTRPCGRRSRTPNPSWSAAPPTT